MTHVGQKGITSVNNSWRGQGDDQSPPHPSARLPRVCLDGKGGARFETQGGLTKKIAAQHINCQFTMKIQEFNKNVSQTCIKKEIRIYFLFISDIPRLNSYSIWLSDYFFNHRQRPLTYRIVLQSMSDYGRASKLKCSTNNVWTSALTQVGEVQHVPHARIVAPRMLLHLRHYHHCTYRKTQSKILELIPVDLDRNQTEQSPRNCS
jgi:hypothetical protein